MKRITNFIIDKRNLILVIFIVLTIISALVSSKVNINYDMANYLPDNSETRIGMDIMEKEFPDTETSSLNVMFEGLKKAEKETIRKQLTEIDGITDVAYDTTETFNKGKYTLYVITVGDKSDSNIASKVYDKIINKYEDKKIYTSGAISETNKTVLPFFIVGLAVFCALVILIIMCESYAEPFLFLATILMAVVLNKGTNIIFSSVSNITNSIVAILQMALSMDYSIMLMNRYNQEKANEKDKVIAMKKALHKAFQSISSSSVTTIVGLLALVFMSFKIGKDLGFVLAKGVLFSLICIFFVLPSLILMFDKLIVKTKKKSIQVSLNKLGRISYKFRFVLLPLFIIIFILSFSLKGNLGIDYTDRQADEISTVFKENNQIALIYPNKDETKIAKHLKMLENKKSINEVLAYSNTINQKLTYDKLNKKLQELKVDTKVEDYLLRIIYYNYYNPESDNKMTFEEFINFIETTAYNNPKISIKIDSTVKQDINKLKYFVTETEINKERTPEEIATILGFDSNQLNDILIYYNSKNNLQTMTLNEFISFMNKDVLTNNKYSTAINNDSKNQLKSLSQFTQKNNIIKKMTANQLAQFFNMDKNTTNELFKYYALNNETNIKMTISEFSNFVVNNLLIDSNYTNSFNEETINNIKLLQTFSNKDIINQEVDSSSLASLFNIPEETVKQILLLKYLTQENTNKYTITDFLNYVTYIKLNTHYLDNLDTNFLEQIKANEDLLNNNAMYSVQDLATLLNIDAVNINQLYNLIDYVTGNTTHYKSNPKEFVNLLLNYNNIDSIDQNILSKLKLLQTIMINTDDNTAFTYQELANVIGIESTTIKNIYALYTASQNNITLNPLEFVTFILQHREDEMLKDKLSTETIKQLQLLKTVMESSLTDQKYSSASLSSLLGIDKENLELLYGLYDSLYIDKSQKISLNKFIEFITNDVMTNTKYTANFDSKNKKRLNTIKAIMKNSLNNTQYTSDELFAIINNLSNDIEKDMLELLYIYYGSYSQYNDNWEMTLEEFINYLNNNILKDKRFVDFIDEDMKENIRKSKKTIKDSKKLLVGPNYSRIVLNTNLDLEAKETFKTIKEIKKDIGQDLNQFYVIGDSPMAYEMSQTFNGELNTITIITMIFIFIVVAITFKSIIIPTILVLTIQCAVYLIMGILSFTGDNVYFISLLIVQSILMGATIDYAILYTSYYLEMRKSLGIKQAIIESYNKSIHTILTSSSILIIVTLIIACFTTAIAAKICKTISQGTICSTILILVLLPAMLAACDKFIVKNKQKD